MNQLAERTQIRRTSPIAYLKLLFSKDFRKLMSVCLKMLFRKSTRKRFALLVLAFMFMIAFNTGNYVKKFHGTEIQKQTLLSEKAFKLFFLRMNTRNNCARFLSRQQKKLADLGVSVLDRAFVYQNNLFAHFYSAAEMPSVINGKNTKPIEILYGVLGVDDLAKNFFLHDKSDLSDIKVRDIYIDYNGTRLDKNSIVDRDEELKDDITDMADAIRGNIKGRRLDVFNTVKNRVIDNMIRVPLSANYEPNPYLSRLQAVVPMNLLYILTNIRNDNTTDIMELPESVAYGKDNTLTVFKDYLEVFEHGPLKISYGDIEEIYPRYLPLYIADLLTPQWNWLMYQQIKMKTDFMNYINQIHFKGHYLFSYEKSHIIKDKVKKINDDIRSNHIFFYLTDLSMGIVFPFMMSLFAFIHLKTEIAFLLMYKNQIREILYIFWLLPVTLMLLIKGSVIFAYWLDLFGNDSGIQMALALPLLITFIFAAVIFFPVNKWCFSQFTDDRLNLHELHKGR